MAEGATMTLDLDIYCSANLLVKQHGEDAPLEVNVSGDLTY